MSTATATVPEVLAPALPGELTPDEALVDSVVTSLNAVWRAKGLELARALSQIVLDALFAGSARTFLDRRSRHASFRALAAREDLQVGYHALWTSVAVVAQLPALPAPAAEALPLSHHKALLLLADLAAKARLATEALDRGWSKRQLEAEVRKARTGEAAPPARPRKPPVFSALERMIAAAAAAAEGMPDAKDVARFGVERTRTLVAQAEEELDALTSALVDLRRALDEAAAADPNA